MGACKGLVPRGRRRDVDAGRDARKGAGEAGVGGWSGGGGGARLQDAVRLQGGEQERDELLAVGGVGGVAEAGEGGERGGGGGEVGEDGGD